MSRTVRGNRDGSGPYKGSARSGVGRRQAAGVKCPNKGKRTK